MALNYGLLLFNAEIKKYIQNNSSGETNGKIDYPLATLNFKWERRMGLSKKVY